MSWWQYEKPPEVQFHRIMAWTELLFAASLVVSWLLSISDNWLALVAIIPLLDSLNHFRQAKFFRNLEVHSPKHSSDVPLATARKR
jgi:hypothetical protein